MRKQQEIIQSEFNDLGKNFDYRKKEILFDRFKGWFDKTNFILDNDKYMGWGKYVSDCGTLRIGTACFDGGEWLDTVQHTSKANNPYNNYVNAIAYWDLLNEKGRKFFLAFYSEEIKMQKATIAMKIGSLKNQIAELKAKNNRIDLELSELSK